MFEQLDTLQANQALATQISAALAPLAQHPRVRNARHLGMCWAWDVDTTLPDFAQRYHAVALRHGLLLRPIGHTLYCMPPYVLDATAIGHLGRAALAALDGCLLQEQELSLQST